MSFDHDPFVVTLHNLLSPDEAAAWPLMDSVIDYSDVYVPSSRYGVQCHDSRGVSDRVPESGVPSEPRA